MTITLKQFCAGIVFGLTIALFASGIYDGAITLFIVFILLELLIYITETK